MDPMVLIETLQVRGVRFRAEGDQIRVAPASLMTPGELEKVRQNKRAVLAALTGMCQPCTHERDEVVYLIQWDGCPVCDWTLCALCKGCLRARFQPDAQFEKQR